MLTRLYLLLLLLAPVRAEALSATWQSGPALDVGLGGGGLAYPFVPRGQLSGQVGWWVGRYDDVFALGRYFGLAVGADAGLSDHVLIRPNLELRRGMDLLVLSLYGFAAGGPVFYRADVEEPNGWSGQLGIGVRYRRHRYWGVGLRLAGGVITRQGQLGGDLSLQASWGWMRPVGKR